MRYFEPVAYFTHLTKFYTIIKHSQHQFFVPTMSIQVSILKYILTESGGSILQCKNRNLKKNSLVAWSHSKWLNCKDTCKSRVGQNYKRQKNLLNTKTVWEILLTHALAEADAGRGGGTPCKSRSDPFVAIRNRTKL